MKKLVKTMLLVVLIGLVSCKNENKKTENESNTEQEIVQEETKVVKEAPLMVSLKLESKSGSTAVGKCAFSESNGVVTMEAKFFGLKPGMHAIHIHEKADCSSDDGKSAGGHWNPTFTPHGKWGAPEGYHKGDIGNFEADAEGNGRITMTTDEWCIGCDDPNKDILGKSIIVHEAEDDFVTQPTGNAGGRVSCGGIIQ